VGELHLFALANTITDPYRPGVPRKIHLLLTSQGDFTPGDQSYEDSDCVTFLNFLRSRYFPNYVHQHLPLGGTVRQQQE
jgi:hypothetical protein